MDTATWVREVERIAREAAGAQGKTIEIGGIPFSTVPLHDMRPKEATPPVLGLSTLESMVEYVKGERDRAYLADRRAFFHIESPHSVRIVTGLFGVHNQRMVVAIATGNIPPLRIGCWLDPEDFVIEVASCYEDNIGRAQVLATCGNLQAEQVQTIEDDGVSQTAVARKGIVGRATVTIAASPVVLRPRRTFSEVAQPESPFVLRLRGGGEGRKPQCALFLADGGAWELQAIARIKAYLTTELAGAMEVYG